MTKTEIEKIVNKYDWEKRWLERNCLLTAGLAGEMYYVDFPKNWKKMVFAQLFFAYHDGMITCYQLKSENDEFGNAFAADLINDAKLAKSWARETHKAAERLLEYIKQKPSVLLTQKNYEEFIKIFFAFLVPYVGLIRIINYVEPQFQANILPPLNKVRLEVEDVYSKVDFFLRKFLSELAKSENRTEKLIGCLYPSEVRKYLERKILPTDQELIQRTPDSGEYFDNGKLMYFDKTSTALFEKLVADKYLVASLKTEVEGVVAVKGIARGIVRIVNDAKKVKLFNLGDILITGMTNPEFMSLMKKSGAVVTDGGGILCHAAIVARELNKPCIINTQVATSVFKDGDLVEVDADKGMVRKI